MQRVEGKKFVACTWRDPHGSGKENCLYDHELPHAPVVVTTYGWLARQDDKGVSLVGEVISDGTMRDYTFVPTELIEEVKEIKIPKANGHRKGKVAAQDASRGTPSQADSTPSPTPPPTAQSRDGM
jgi:hypothetical protein